MSSEIQCAPTTPLVKRQGRHHLATSSSSAITIMLIPPISRHSRIPKERKVLARTRISGHDIVEVHLHTPTIVAGVHGVGESLVERGGSAWGWVHHAAGGGETRVDGEMLEVRVGGGRGRLLETAEVEVVPVEVLERELLRGEVVFVAAAGAVEVEAGRRGRR